MGTGRKPGMLSVCLSSPQHSTHDITPTCNRHTEPTLAQVMFVVPQHNTINHHHYGMRSGPTLGKDARKARVQPCFGQCMCDPPTNAATCQSPQQGQTVRSTRRHVSDARNDTLLHWLQVAASQRASTLRCAVCVSAHTRTQVCVVQSRQKQGCFTLHGSTAAAPGRGSVLLGMLAHPRCCSCAPASCIRLCVPPVELLRLD